MPTASSSGRRVGSSAIRSPSRPSPSRPSLADSRVGSLADVLVNYSTSVEPGQLVLLETTPLSAPLLRELYRRVVDAGGHPHVRLGLDGAAEALLTEGSDEQIDWVNPMRREDFEQADVRIAVEASGNTRELTGV